LILLIFILVDFNPGWWYKGTMENGDNKMTFDFQDGNGPVSAHQHPNGGGWVADTATVVDTVYVGPNAKIYGNAWIYDDAWVFGNAEVTD